MYRQILIAAALIAPALATPTLAQAATGVHAENGATSGRSPHRAYRDASPRGDCQPAMHSIPAGKGHVWGRHALPGERCVVGAVAIARADTSPPQD